MSLWDLFQHMQIEDVRSTAEGADRKIESQRFKVDDVRGELERLSLACQAMWELLRDQTGLTEDQLRDKILEVDSRDGKTDGKMGPEVIQCPHCRQKTNTGRGRCVLCGGQLVPRHTFKS